MAFSSSGTDNLLPGRNFRPGNIFIGRVHEINTFRFYLDQWQGFMKSFSASTDAPANVVPVPNSKNRIQGLVVLLYGRGGFGKSTLLERYRQIAREPQWHLKVGEIVDWELVVEGNRNMFSPLQGQEIDAGAYFGVLRAQLADALGRRGAPFREYDKAVAAVERARKQFDGELDNLRKDDRYNWLMKVGSQEVVAVMRAAVPALNLVPGIDVLADGAKQGLELVAEFGVQQARHLHDRLRDRLGAQTFNDYLAPAFRLGVSLGSDLASFARDFPLLIFFDTYELVDEGDRLLRIVMGAADSRVGWVIAGRDNLWAGEEQRKRTLQRVEGYKEIVERGLPVDFNAGGVGAFTASDIVTYFEELCLSVQDPPAPLTEEEAVRVYDITQGVPLAVRIAAGLYLETGNLDIVTAKADGQREIVDLMVQRYLQHVQDDQGERGRLRGLALLRRADQPAAIAAALGLTPEQAATSYETELSRLHRRYSFIFNEGTKKLLHQEVRYFLRLWLRENRDDPEIIAVNRRLWQAHADTLQALETNREYTNLRQRLEDDEWAGVYLDLVEQQFWLDPAMGVQYSLPFMLAAAVYRRKANQEVMIVGKFFVQELKQPYRNWWQWATESLVPVNSSNPSPEALQGLEELALLVGQRSLSFLLSLPDYRAELEAALWWRLGEAFESQDIYKSREWYEKAFARLKEDTQLREDVAGINHKIAEKLIFEVKQYKESLPYLERALELKPGYTKALNGCGVVHRKLKQYEQSLKDFNKALELDPSYVFGYNSRGNLYYDRGEYELALRDYNKILELDPDNALAYYSRGRLYSKRKQYEQALQDFDKVLELDPGDVDAYYGRSNLYYVCKEYDLALQDSNKALELDPGYVKVYINIAYIYLLKKDVERSEENFRHSWELDKSDVNIGWMAEWVGLSKQRSGLELAERLEKVAEIDPKDYVALVCVGVALGLRGNLSAALEKLKQAISFSSHDWDAYFWKGMTCAYIGRYTAASEAIDRALELDLPPLLLTPLYWLEHDRPDFFREYARPLLEKYGV